MAGMTGVFNQYFSDSLSERTKYRMQAAVKAGRFVWKAPLGYTNPKDGAGSTIKMDAERAPLVRKGFELMASGITTLTMCSARSRPLVYELSEGRAAKANVARDAPQPALRWLGEVG